MARIADPLGHDLAADDLRATPLVDRWLFLAINGLLVAGLLMLFSATYPKDAQPSGSEKLAGDATATFTRQLMISGVGYLLMLGLMLLRPDWLKKIAVPLFGLSLFLLVLVLFLHPEQGFHRWIKLPFRMTFQPSELAKFSLILLLATLVAARPELLCRGKGYLGVLAGLVLIPASLVAIETDLGTAMVIVIGGIATLALGRARLTYVLVTIVVLGAIFVGAAMYRPAWGERIWSVVHYADDGVRNNEGLQLYQSLIAVGSGGLTGRGYCNSLQKYGYLPMAENDFILAIVAEETGALGAGALLGLIGFISIYGLYKASRLDDPFRQLLAGGVCLVIGFQAAINAGVILGVLPTTGVPFPFVSAGGSARLVYLAALGIMLSALREEEQTG